MSDLDTLLRRFDPPIRTRVREARKTLRHLMPTATELVYENRSALVISFASSQRKADTIVSLAIYKRGVNLYFMYGAGLDDPQGLLLGTGTQGRFVRLDAADLLDRETIRALIAAAVAEGDTPLPTRGRGQLIIKSVAARRH